MSETTGKILVVDNEYDSAVEKAITTLIQKNLCVQYWDGNGNLPDTIKNVRVVILDLDLAGVGYRSPGLIHYQLPAKALNKIPGPYLVIIMARDFMKEDPVNLAQAYRDIYDKPICGLISRTGLTKYNESQDPKLIKEIIDGSISIEDMLKMTFLWEEVIDGATDIAFNDLIPSEVDSTISTIIKMFCKEMGDEAAARELVDLIMQLVSRRVMEGKSFEELKKLISVINKKKIKAINETVTKADIHNRIMFFQPKLNEKPWTGDIYRVEDQGKYFQYAIILNSPCDLAQKKAWSFRICFGFSIKEEYFEDFEYPPYKIDHCLVEKAEGIKNKKLDQHSLIPKARERYLSGSKLCESLYTLYNIKEENSFIKICFDFNNVKSIEINQLANWKRICRLDSPFIEELLQKYGNHAFRIGTMPINKPA